jgi:hypothetical protein
MVKLLIEGKADQVQLIFDELKQWPHLKVIQVKTEEQEECDRKVVSCMVQYQPYDRVKKVKIEAANGATVDIPFLNLITAVINEGRMIFAGRVYDIFATPKGERYSDHVLL